MSKNKLQGIEFRMDVEILHDGEHVAEGWLTLTPSHHEVVVISGEVLLPGIYEIRPKKEE